MLLWLAGWSGLSDRLKDDPISRSILKKKGVGVATSAIFAPLGTAFGVWTVAHSSNAAVVAGLVVLVLVLVGDRGYVYASDTQSKVKWTGMFRQPLALAIAFLTAYAVFVHFNYGQLEATSSDMRLERADDRQATINDLTGLQSLRTADQNAANRLSALREQRLKLPEDIERKKAAAEACAKRADRRMDRLLRRGVSRRDSQASVVSERRRCNQQSRDARDEEELYFAGIDSEIERSRTAADSTANALKEGLARKGQLAEQANAIDAQAVESTSFAVVTRYLRDSWLALIELVVIYIAISFCDAAGLLMASIYGRSPAGCEFERDRLAAEAITGADRANAYQQIVQAESLIRQTTKAAKKNLVVKCIQQKIVEVQTAMTSENASASERAAPVMAVAASINTMIAAALEAEEAAQRAHKVSPSLGRAADRSINEAFAGLAT